MKLEQPIFLNLGAHRVWPGLYSVSFTFCFYSINPLNAELNPIRHLLALVGARHIVHVSRMRVKDKNEWSHTSNLPVRFQAADRESFTFYLRHLQTKRHKTGSWREKKC